MAQKKRKKNEEETSRREGGVEVLLQQGEWEWLNFDLRLEEEEVLDSVKVESVTVQNRGDLKMHFGTERKLIQRNDEDSLCLDLTIALFVSLRFSRVGE